MAWNEPGNNGRDPWGNGNKNRNDQGPPDLDEVVKKLQDGLNGLFGRSGGSGSGGSDSGGDGGEFHISGKLIGGIVSLVIVIWAGFGLYKIDALLKFIPLLKTVGPRSIKINELFGINASFFFTSFFSTTAFCLTSFSFSISTSF